jgi:undecaprenyl-diphosphatase
MNLDLEILNYFNSFAQKVPPFDVLVKIISTNHLIKGGFFMIVFWYLWFQKNTIKDRSTMISNIAGSVGVMIAARTLAMMLPFRDRPKLNTELNFLLPIGSRQEELMSNSSFPSDHAALFFSLAMGFFLVSRKAGIAAFLYTFCIICLPRIYLGLHYPSDILCGAVLGILGVLIANMQPVKSRLAPSLLRSESAYPGLFYASLFLISFQIASLFEESREIMKYFTRLLSA